MTALASHHLDQKLVYLNPTDPFNMYLKVSFLAGIFVASPFVLYQVWAFIAPGLYRNERRYVLPFMFSTVGLFLAGGYFGYKMVYPAALDFLISFSGQFTPMITVQEYTDLFLTIIAGLGIVFEMPILVFFLSLMGILSAGWMWRNFRYSILVIFIIAAIITPTTDIMNMCIFRRAHDRALRVEHRHRLALSSHPAQEARSEKQRQLATRRHLERTIPTRVREPTKPICPGLVACGKVLLPCFPVPTRPNTPISIRTTSPSFPRVQSLTFSRSSPASTAGFSPEFPTPKPLLLPRRASGASNKSWGTFATPNAS
jgi:Tat protein translocase TatC